MFYLVMRGGLTNADNYFRDKHFDGLCGHILNVIKTAQMLLDSDFLKAVLFDDKWRTNVSCTTVTGSSTKSEAPENW
ncbi:hypothetical protein A0H81_10592 [Grifola frondosa]|uniref:Uncharacterized protein n=1 Tax=Grifola frondosa TaxID=5627 RepID=A0A1C7LZH5_GRIFR|nr:hypothetical protein A0H81_10592 [Grifola frondosa]